MMRLALIAGVLLFASAAEAAPVYKCVDAYGRVQYSDKPCANARSEQLDIESRPTDTAAVMERREQRKTEIGKLDAAEEEAAKAQAEERRKAEERATQCRQARERLAKMEQERLMYREKDGQREYLSSEEIVAKRQQQQDRVNELCGKQD